MEYNLPSEIVKDLNFGDSAKTRIIKGVEKLANAVNIRMKIPSVIIPVESFIYFFIVKTEMALSAKSTPVH